MDVGPLFIANTQATKLIEPSERPFYHPAPLPQSAPMFRVAPSDHGQNMAGKQTLADCLGVIATVA